jgi:hypothetical protein
LPNFSVVQTTRSRLPAFGICFLKSGFWLCGLVLKLFNQSGLFIDQQLLNLAELAFNFLDSGPLLANGGVGEKGHVIFITVPFFVKFVIRPGYGESLIVKEVFNPLHEFQIAPSVDSLAGSVFYRLQAGKNGFPVSQYMRFNFTDLADLSNFVKEFLSYLPGLDH